MDSLTLLKQEINETSDKAHDLAKWKLIVTAALGAAAFGLSKQDPNYWLLFFVPFVCAYIDLYIYQLQLRVRIIAQFLREHGGTDLLQQYEQKCEDLRGPGKHYFSLDLWAGFLCSFFVSISGPVLLHLSGHARPEDLNVSSKSAEAIWGSGVLLIIVLFVVFIVMAEKFTGRHDVHDATPAAQEN